jgi:hypothetical protein
VLETKDMGDIDVLLDLAQGEIKCAVMGRKDNE